MKDIRWMFDVIYFFVALIGILLSFSWSFGHPKSKKDPKSLKRLSFDSFKENRLNHLFIAYAYAFALLTILSDLFSLFWTEFFTKTNVYSASLGVLLGYSIYMFMLAKFNRS
ncbi:hypothetical protein BVX98_02970 [bacterium F11]|nr:hypothetical protein BVX98_02970 [bacterium F11]